MQRFKFNNGDKVKDIITGFEGIVTCRTEYLTGCDRYGVQEQKVREGKILDWVHFDENVLVLVTQKKVEVETAAVSGGPRPDAPNR